jgi:predicted nucleotidyltransferase
MSTARSEELRALAQRVADGVPAEVAGEVVLTGSVSRGVADEASDIEMLVVLRDPRALEDCFALARAAGLDELATWGAQEGPARRVSGRLQQVPVELIFWPHEFAVRQVETLREGQAPSTADALVHGVPLRTGGLLAAWQDALRHYPPALAARQIEEAALPWGGFAAAGVLTLIRPGDRLALVEWILDGSIRVLTIVYALNGVWRPTTKRLGSRVHALPRKPDQLANRIEDALTEPDPRSALLVATELQLDTVLLAQSGPNVDRARTWLAVAAEVLRTD